jgi:hypothetical protein
MKKIRIIFVIVLVVIVLVVAAYLPARAGGQSDFCPKPGDLLIKHSVINHRLFARCFADTGEQLWRINCTGERFEVDEDDSGWDVTCVK